MSYAGKLILLNSTVTSLLIYTMCMLKFPPKLIEMLDKIRRRCLWIKKTDQGDKRNTLAAWDMVCKPKNKGGLGVINLRVQNEALLMKFLRKFYNKMDIPWVQLTWDTYYNQKIPHATDPVGSFWWRDVLKLSPNFRWVSPINIVCGTTALFWKDMWSDELLQDSHPRAFSYAANEDVSVKDFLRITSLGEAFHLPLSPQAHAEVRDMQTIVTLFQPMTAVSDVWYYIWGKTVFKSTDYYRFFFREVQSHQVFVWLWKSKCTMKLKVFGWLLLNDRLNTRNMLKRRHYNIREDHNCLLCGLNIEETVQHMIFTWSFSRQCWTVLGIDWIPFHGRLQAIQDQINAHIPRQCSWRNSLWLLGACGRKGIINTLGQLTPPCGPGLIGSKETFISSSIELKRHISLLCSLL